MKKRKAVSPIVVAVILCAIAVAVAVTIAYLMTEVIQPYVNGEEVAQKKYYLGDLIYANNIEYYYYHGIDDAKIVIGHWLTNSMSNMYVRVSLDQFYIEGELFKIIDYDAHEGWIILEG